MLCGVMCQESAAHALEESARFPRVPKPWERVISGGNAYFGTSTSLGNASFCSIFTYESSVPKKLQNSWERMPNVTSQCVRDRKRFESVRKSSHSSVNPFE